MTVDFKSKLQFIIGPCVIESESSCCQLAEKIKAIALKEKTEIVFKASYDKANRTSIKSFRGPGIEEGIKILAKIKRETELPILSDVHTIEEIDIAKETLDIIQIPAFLCRQTDLIVHAAETEKIINIKKGQFIAPWDVANIVLKILSTGNNKILLTERGVSFGYNNVVSDMRSIIIMKKLGYPVVYDATHSIQLPSGETTESGGEPEMIEPLALAAVATGCDGLFIETHENPKKALSDSACMLPFKSLRALINKANSMKYLLHYGR